MKSNVKSNRADSHVFIQGSGQISSILTPILSSIANGTLTRMSGESPNVIYSKFVDLHISDKGHDIGKRCQHIYRTIYFSGNSNFFQVFQKNQFSLIL